MLEEQKPVVVNGCNHTCAAVTEPEAAEQQVKQDDARRSSGFYKAVYKRQSEHERVFLHDLVFHRSWNLTLIRDTMK